MLGDNMNKKLLILFGSPKREGNTARVVRQLVTEIPRNILIEEYSAYDLKAKPCVDCGYCKTNRGCAFHDLDSFFEAFEEADYVVFATPVYNQSFPSPLKAVLERTQRYYNLRFAQNVKPPIEKRRKCGLIAVSGTDEEKAYEHMASVLEQALSVLNGELSATLAVRDTDQQPLGSDLPSVKSFVIKLLLS